MIYASEIATSKKGYGLGKILCLNVSPFTQKKTLVGTMKNDHRMVDFVVDGRGLLRCSLGSNNKL